MSFRTSLLQRAAVSLAVAAASSTGSAAATPTGEPLAEVVVTGSRGQPRTVLSSPTAIHVHGGEPVERFHARLQFRGVLTPVVPLLHSSPGWL